MIHQKHKKSLEEITNDLCPVLSVQQLYRIRSVLQAALACPICTTPSKRRLRAPSACALYMFQHPCLEPAHQLL